MATLKKEDVLAFLKHWESQYEQGDSTYFDAFAQNATFFTVSNPMRIDGREEFRREFEPHLTDGKKRRSQVFSPDVRVEDGIAVVSYHNRVAVEGQPTLNLRVSLTIVAQPDGSLRIIQMHVSFLHQLPESIVSTLAPGETVRALEERVASAAASAGTPK